MFSSLSTIFEVLFGLYFTMAADFMFYKSIWSYDCYGKIKRIIYKKTLYLDCNIPRTIIHAFRAELSCTVQKSRYRAFFMLICCLVCILCASYKAVPIEAEQWIVIGTFVFSAMCLFGFFTPWFYLRLLYKLLNKRQQQFGIVVFVILLIVLVRSFVELDYTFYSGWYASLTESQKQHLLLAGMSAPIVLQLVSIFTMRCLYATYVEQTIGNEIFLFCKAYQSIKDKEKDNFPKQYDKTIKAIHFSKDDAQIKDSLYKEFESRMLYRLKPHALLSFAFLRAMLHNYFVPSDEVPETMKKK